MTQYLPKNGRVALLRLPGGLSAKVGWMLLRIAACWPTFYRWYDRYLQRGEAGLQDQSPKPKHVWNRIPDQVRFATLPRFTVIPARNSIFSLLDDYTIEMVA